MNTIETVGQIIRFATLTVKPITCEKGAEIYTCEELLRESWNGYNELRQETEHFCDGHCSQVCHADLLRKKLESTWKENIRLKKRTAFSAVLFFNQFMWL